MSVGPQRYLQNQKEEIKRLVKDMLHVGIIQPSQNPFFISMLLVKTPIFHGGFA